MSERRELPAPPALHCRIPAVAERLPALRHALRDWAVQLGLAPDDVEDLTLAGYEAMANVVAHAYGSEPGELELRADCDPENNFAVVTVIDQGRWQPPSATPGPLHGRGLPLMRQLGQAEINADDGGTTVRMSWKLTR
jgi:serine/threonine-protein kinase RsbW